MVRAVRGSITRQGLELEESGTIVAVHDAVRPFVGIAEIESVIREAEVHGAAILPDANAHGLGQKREPLYSVCFEATEVWGEAAEPRECLYVDLWESYLEEA